jgi:hypothetical protein
VEKKGERRLKEQAMRTRKNEEKREDVGGRGRKDKRRKMEG